LHWAATPQFASCAPDGSGQHKLLHYQHAQPCLCLLAQGVHGLLMVYIRGTFQENGMSSTFSSSDSNEFPLKVMIHRAAFFLFFFLSNVAGQCCHQWATR